jgi:thymidylate synthase (FAD)
MNKIVKPYGFVKLIDVMPRIVPSQFDNNVKCDYSIAEAARVSYSSSKKVNDDSSLIKYLYAHEHTTPFEMVTFKFHIKAPIFIVRQWQRHRMSTYNEISGRYSVMNPEFWFPEPLMTQSLTNKQGSGLEINNELLIKKWDTHNKNAYSLYLESLDSGVSRELSRTVLPLSTYTEFYWKIDLHNLLRFIRLRSDSHAQKEIREYSDSLKEIVKEYCPVSMEAFEEYSYLKLSKTEVNIIKNKLDAQEHITSKSQMKEFKEKLGILGLE